MSERTSTRETNRWNGVDAVAWIAVAVGLFTREPGVFLIAAVGVVFTTYARLGTPPEPSLAVTRQLDDTDPEPGQPVTVDLTVRNVDEGLLPDVRVVDGVPPVLGVCEGSPHRGTVLGPGEAETLTYTLSAERGTHTFAPVTVVCRSLNGAHETILHESVSTELTCEPSMRGSDAPPLRSLLSHHGGAVPTDSGGSGVEFYGVRPYRPGDRANRIDWARRARTGELATLEFREEWRATTILLVDARTPAYVTTAHAASHGVEWSVRAAAKLFAGLLDSGNRVGLARIERLHRRRRLRALHRADVHTVDCGPAEPLAVAFERARERRR